MPSQDLERTLLNKVPEVFHLGGILRTELTCTNRMKVISKLSCSSCSHLKHIQRRWRRYAQASRIPSANYEQGMRWKISPQWTMHRQSWADTALPLFVSLCFNHGHSTVSSKKKKKKKNLYKCPSSPEMSRLKKNRGEKSPGKIFKIFSTFKKFPVFFQFSEASVSKISSYVGKSVNCGICSKVTFPTNMKK